MLGHVSESNAMVVQPICGENACSYYGDVPTNIGK